LVGFSTTRAYSGLGADIVMESITRFDRWSLSVKAIFQQLTDTRPTQPLQVEKRAPNQSAHR